jgi:hypothetical protein
MCVLEELGQPHSGACGRLPLPLAPQYPQECDHNLCIMCMRCSFDDIVIELYEVALDEALDGVKVGLGAGLIHKAKRLAQF